MDLDQFRNSVEDASALLRDVQRVMPGMTVDEFLHLAETVLDKKNTTALRLLRNSLNPSAIVRIQETA